MIQYLHWGMNCEGPGKMYRNGTPFPYAGYFLFTIFSFGIVIYDCQDENGKFLLFPGRNGRFRKLRWFSLGCFRFIPSEAKPYPFWGPASSMFQRWAGTKGTPTRRLMQLWDKKTKEEKARDAGFDHRFWFGEEKGAEVSEVAAQ